ncbi:MAG TPA: peptidoglycan-binding protein LysM, partial [Firmicutes bacterium]|nr:peptidoglycan-binding protein LysM [Bacillota bacterium]
MFSIANRFGISVECLRRFNPEVSGDQIFPGQVLCIPPAS